MVFLFFASCMCLFGNEAAVSACRPGVSESGCGDFSRVFIRVQGNCSGFRAARREAAGSACARGARSLPRPAACRPEVAA